MRPKSLSPFGSALGLFGSEGSDWGCETPIKSIKNPINTHFLTNITTPPSLTDFSKKDHTDSTDSTKKP